MENFKSALLDFVKFQNAQQLQLQEWIETHQLLLQERMEKFKLKKKIERKVKRNSRNINKNGWIINKNSWNIKRK